jgi:hypothetical protein
VEGREVGAKVSIEGCDGECLSAVMEEECVYEWTVLCCIRLDVQ